MSLRLAMAHWRDLDVALLIRDGQLHDLAVDRPDAPRLYHSIWRGRVGRLAPGLGAFIKLDETHTGLLKESLPSSGQAVTVQVKSLRGEGKADIVTTDIALPGRYLVYLPNATGFRSSRRGPAVAPGILSARAGGGIAGGIRRQTAGTAVPDEILADATALRRTWTDVEGHTGMGLLKPGPDAAERLRTDHPGEDLPLAEATDDFAWTLDRLLHPRVDLGQGASVLIEPTAALTAIDVNTGTRSATDANALAAEEIVRHIRLRNLSGLIMIDFASDPAKARRDALLESLKRALADDPAGCRFAGTTPSGLVELTRPRRTLPLHDIVQENVS